MAKRNKTVYNRGYAFARGVFHEHQPPALDQYLYEFDREYQVSYVSYSRANELVDAQLILTLEKAMSAKPLPLISHNLSISTKILLLATVSTLHH